MRDLEGRVAVVTGAASGIGAGLARALAAQGCHLALADVNKERLNEVADELSGVRVTSYNVDVANRAQVEALATSVVHDHGAAHLLFNNAGVAAIGAFEDMPIEDFEWVVAVNLWGVVYGCKAFLPILKAQDAGHIVNISSLFGIMGVPSHTAYCATKFAVKGFSDALSVELSDSHVRVTTVHPGAVSTRIAENARFHRLLFGQTEDKARKLIRAGLSGDEAGRRIVRAVQKNARRLVLGTDAKVLATIQRLLPTRYLDLMRLDPTRMKWRRRRITD